VFDGRGIATARGRKWDAKTRFDATVNAFGSKILAKVIAAALCATTFFA